MTFESWQGKKEGPLTEPEIAELAKHDADEELAAEAYGTAKHEELGEDLRNVLDIEAGLREIINPDGQ
jgi:hypothetical protein